VREDRGNWFGIGRDRRADDRQCCGQCDTSVPMPQGFHVAR